MTFSDLFLPLVFGWAYFLLVPLSLLGFFFMLPISRNLHGGNLYWEEFSIFERWTFILVALLFSFLPVVNLVATVYHLSFIALGYQKRSQRGPLTIAKRSYPTRGDVHVTVSPRKD